MNKRVIQVTHEYSNGHHIFSSDELKGLLVVHKDLQVAYDDVPNCIRGILKLQEGIDYKVSPLKAIPDAPNRQSHFVKQSKAEKPARGFFDSSAFSISPAHA